MSPALTTIRQDKRGLGEAAARALVQLVEDAADGVPPVWTLPVELVVRESSGAAKEVA